MKTLALALGIFAVTLLYSGCASTGGDGVSGDWDGWPPYGWETAPKGMRWQLGE